MSKLAIIVSLCLLAAADAGAQSLGFGARLSFVQPDLLTDDTNRVSGVMVRLRTSTKTALELSYDFDTPVAQNLLGETKDSPFQGSLLLYLTRSALAPYLLGGIGWQSETVNTIQNGEVVGSTTSRESRYHAGLGAEVGIGRHAAVHVDYRYIHLGANDDADSESGAIPIPGLRWIQDKMGLSHKATAWTTGVTVYF